LGKKLGLSQDEVIRGQLLRYMKRLKIVTMQATVESLSLNFSQKCIDRTLFEQHKRGYPMRVLVLKARREGVSTYFAARFFAEINLRPNRFATISSVDLDASQKVFAMSRMFQSELDTRRPTDFSSRKEIIYSAPHRSQLLVQTAGKDVLGRGGLTHYFHASEAAFWSSFKEQFGGAAQEVPDDKGTIIALESTGNGIGGAFYDMYMDAKDQYRRFKDYSNYLALFLPWYIFSDYVMDVPKKFRFKYDEYEQSLRAKFNLTDEQLYWRRWAIRNKCQNDLHLFQQEYPATVDEAFQAGGRTVFAGPVLDAHQRKVTEGRTCLFDKIDDIRPVNVDKSFECWQIWKLPRDHQYTIGFDVAEGKLSNPASASSIPDCHAGVIYDRNTSEVVGIYRGRCEHKDLARQALLAGRFYNNAWIAPELPHGMAMLQYLKDADYENIYNRQVHDDRYDIDESEALGWRTTTLTRPIMTQTLVDAVHNFNITIYSADILSEMRSFIIDKNGKQIHRKGRNDDLLFALMIALQLHIRCEFESEPYPDDFVADGETVEDEEEIFA